LKRLLKLGLHTRSFLEFLRRWLLPPLPEFPSPIGVLPQALTPSGHVDGQCRILDEHLLGGFLVRTGPARGDELSEQKGEVIRGSNGGTVLGDLTASPLKR